MRPSIILRQLFSAPSYTYTYLVGCGVTRKALLIDAVLEEAQRDIQLVNELGLDLEYSLNTHMHADHVRSCEELRKTFPKLKSVQGDKLGKSDILISDNDEIKCGQNVHLSCLHTPGHTPGCFSYFFNHENHPMVFTGDSMLIRKCGRADFPNASASDLYDSIQKTLFSLPDATIVYPGHDYSGFTQSSIGEEKMYNIRCSQGITKDQFIQTMANLNVEPPKNIQYNVTENREHG